MFEFEHWHLVRMWVFLVMLGLLVAYAVLAAMWKTRAAKARIAERQSSDSTATTSRVMIQSPPASSKAANAISAHVADELMA